MARLSGAFLLVLISFAGAQHAAAADLTTYSTSTDKQVPVAAAQAGFDWNGFYAGVYGAYRHTSTNASSYGLGIDAGVNTTFNFVLAGAEIAVEGLGNSAGTDANIQALGRGGVLVGDNGLVYATAGYGLDTGAGGNGSLLLGGGVELGLTNDVSLRAQYLHSFPDAGGTTADKVTLGAQFHF